MDGLPACNDRRSLTMFSTAQAIAHPKALLVLGPADATLFGDADGTDHSTLEGVDTVPADGTLTAASPAQTIVFSKV
jgi:hypothetical protein